RAWAMPSGQYPHSLAFHPQSNHLAVGTRIVDVNATFFKELGGKVWIYDLRDTALPPKEGPSVGLRAERLAYHPGGEMMAVAGGDDHEITLWSLRGETPQRLQTVASQGRAIWGITVSEEGRFLGIRQEKQADPPSPNSRATNVPWRVFDLHERQYKNSHVLQT